MGTSAKRKRLGKKLQGIREEYAQKRRNQNPKSGKNVTKRPKQ